MGRLIVVLLLACLGVSGQTVGVLGNPANILAGETVRVEVDYAGSVPVAALQFEFSDDILNPVIVVAPNKNLYCHQTRCVLVGLNADVIPAGIVVAGDVLVSNPGQSVLSIVSALGAAPDGSAVAVTSSQTITVNASDPDLSGDGNVDSIDVRIAADQDIGLDGRTTADFNGDGQVDIIDIYRLVLLILGNQPG